MTLKPLETPKPQGHQKASDSQQSPMLWKGLVCMDKGRAATTSHYSSTGCNLSLTVGLRRSEPANPVVNDTWLF